MSRSIFRPSLIRLVIIVVVLFSVWALRPHNVARAAYTCYSNGSGPWASASTWYNCGGGYPGASDDVVINPGHIIDTTATTYWAHNIQSWGTIQMGGSFVVTGNYSTYNGTGAVTGYGTFNFLGGTGSEMCGGNMTANFASGVLIYFSPAAGVSASCTTGFSGNLHVGSGTLTLYTSSSAASVRIYNGATLILNPGISLSDSGTLLIDSGGLLDLGTGGSASGNPVTNNGTVRATRNSPGASSTFFGLAGGPNNGFVVQPLTGGFSQLILDWHGEHHPFKTGTSVNRGVGWGEYWVLSVTGSDTARVTIPTRFFVPDANSKACYHVGSTTWNCIATGYDSVSTPGSVTRTPLAINTNLAFAAGANVAADGSPQVGTPGGNALHFDGVNDYVATGATSPAFSNDLTVEAWVRTTDTRLNRDLVAWGNSDTCIGDNAQFRIDNGVLNFGMHDIHGATCGNYDNGWASVVAAGTMISTGDWTHVALVKSGSSISLYVNGQSVATGTINKSLTLNRMAIGSLFYAGSVVDAYLAGDLDEVHVWNTARTADQIRQNMYRQLGGTANLVAVYNFDESSGTTAADSSGNNQHGTLVNFKGSPWHNSGAFAGPRNALNLDGVDDYVNAGASSPAFSTDLTAEAWIRTTDTGVAKDLIAWGSSDTCIGDNAQLRIDNGLLTFGMHDIHGAACGDYDNGWASVAATNPINTGDWTHVALVKNGSAISLYINGLLATTGSINKTLTVDRLTLGNVFLAGSPSTAYYAGDLDEVRIWSVARTAAEIRQNMTTALTGAEANLAAYYRFDQYNAADQTALHDVTTNNRHGTLTNMDAATDWIASSAFNTWLGSDSTDWATAGNWSRNAAPVPADNVGVYDYPLGNIPAITADTTFHSLLIAPNAGLDIAANVTLTGNWLSDDTFSQSAGTVTFGGSGIQALLMSVMGLFDNLTINAGVTLFEGDSSDNVVVNNTFTNNGQVRKSQAVTGTGLQVFGLTGLDIDVQTQGTLSTIQVDRVDSAHPQADFSGGGTFMMDHYYSIAPTGAGYSTEVCADYTDTELGTLTEANLRLCRWTGTGWSCPARGVNSATADNIVCADNVTTFSDWVIGAVNPTAITLNNLSAASQPNDLAPVVMLLAALLGMIGLFMAARYATAKRITD